VDTRVFFPGVKWLGCEADHIPPACAEVQKGCSFTSTPPYMYFFIARCLIKHRICLHGRVLKHRYILTSPFTTVI